MREYHPPLAPLITPFPNQALSCTTPSHSLSSAHYRRVLPGPGMQEMLPVLPLKHCRKSLALPLPDSRVIHMLLVQDTLYLCPRDHSLDSDTDGQKAYADSLKDKF